MSDQQPAVPPKEPQRRVITFRMTAAMHNRIAQAAHIKRMSMNKFLEEVTEEALQEMADMNAPVPPAPHPYKEYIPLQEIQGESPVREGGAT